MALTHHVHLFRVASGVAPDRLWAGELLDDENRPLRLMCGGRWGYPVIVGPATPAGCRGVVEGLRDLESRIPS